MRLRSIRTILAFSSSLLWLGALFPTLGWASAVNRSQCRAYFTQWSSSSLPSLQPQPLSDLSRLESDQITRAQDEINLQIQRSIESIEKLDPLPPRLGGSSESWTSLIRQIPEKQKGAFTLRLLEAHAQSSPKLAAILAQLDPHVPPVREAVSRFLANKMLRSEEPLVFSKSEMVAIWGQDRFRQFFPHTRFGGIDAEHGENFILDRVKAALRLDSLNKQGLDRKWTHEHSTSKQGMSAWEPLGYRPATSFQKAGDFINKLDQPSFLGRITPDSQIRGLTLQGHYEKTGRSVMKSMDGNSGEGQVEHDAQNFLEEVERALNSPHFKKQPRLMSRLFVNQWNLNADGSLIEKMRQKAVDLVEKTPKNSFYPLRLEIHNFPTSETIRKTRDYLSKFQGDPATMELLRSLIQDMEELLGLSSKKAQIADLIQELSAQAHTRQVLKNLASGHENLNAVSRLEQLARLRIRWRLLKSSEDRRLAHFESFTGDRKLSDQAVAVASELLEELSRTRWVSQPEGLETPMSRILAHVGLDDMLSREQVDGFRAMIRSILKDPAMNPLRKSELISKVLQNASDQIFYQLQRDYGALDDRTLSLIPKGKTEVPVRFADATLRSHSIFILSKLSDLLESQIASAKQLQHEVDGARGAYPIEVLNPGEAVGTLRFGKNPMELSPNDIAVFETLPSEMAPVKGVISLGEGARLSHVQLLARSLQIPNTKFSSDYSNQLRALDGQRVKLTAGKEGEVRLQRSGVHEIESQVGLSRAIREEIQIPKPDHSVTTPISWDRLKGLKYPNIAGPKGTQLARMRDDPRLLDAIPDHSILPFGFFDRYAEKTGLKPWVDLLSRVRLSNENLITLISARIARQIEKNPIPKELLDEVMGEVKSLQKRTGHSGGFFVRSDTNIEDLAGFNGAGLNESIPNVPAQPAPLEQAIRKAWVAPFREKSIFWRSMALPGDRVQIAEPSLVIMPTIEAESSGVMISKGGKNWQPGRGVMSSNWGIGSVVEAGTPVEEITLESGSPIRFALTVTPEKPVASIDGGLTKKPVQPGTPVLSLEQIGLLNEKAQQVEQVLGQQPHGWDIEWAIDHRGKIWILQARPNM